MITPDKIDGALPITVSIDRTYIFPSGQLGRFILSQDDSDDVRQHIEITFEQAKSLCNLITVKLA